MKINFVVYQSGSHDSFPIRTSLGIERPQDLEAEKNRYRLPAVFLVDVIHLAKFREMTDVVIDKEKKNIHKGLANYLTNLRGEKIPLIEAVYTKSGRLEQGVQKLLERAVNLGERKLYIVGVTRQLFDDIWKQIGDRAGKTWNRQGAAMKDLSPQTKRKRSNSWLLNELGQGSRVTDELRARYLGDSEDADVVRQMVMLASDNRDPVLILGGTGTGKEIVARQIHQNCGSIDGPFIPVNCGAIPDNLLESELFGYKKGAFTNADTDKDGLWVMADCGTLFLDEIGDLSLASQVKILRALTDGSIRALGATDETEVNARIIAATNRDLFGMAQSGEFREDLYYRLRSFCIRTPSLGDNKDDIPPIAQTLWSRITQGKSEPLPPDILAGLKNQPWRGNVRELKMVLTVLNNLFAGRKLGLEHLKGVFNIEGRADRLDEVPITEKDLILEKAKCLRHLRRAHEIVHACQVAVQDFIKIKASDKQKFDTTRRSLKFSYHELLRFTDFGPAFFPSEETFVAVGKIKDKMTWLTTRLKKNPREVKEFWDVDLATAFKDVQTVLFKGIEKLLSES
jgi:DNA-binding NtrC family response regulator